MRELIVQSDKVLKKKILSFGHSGHIILPKRYKGLNALVVIIDNPEKDVKVVFTKKSSHKGRMEV
jgi:putative transposon-encoded protein